MMESMSTDGKNSCTAFLCLCLVPAWTGCSSAKGSGDGDLEVHDEAEPETGSDPVVEPDVPPDTEADPCEGILCSGHGRCVLEDGPTCLCDEGYVNAGDLACELDPACNVCPAAWDRRCEGDTVQECRLDSEGCLTWEDVVTCSGELGACIAPHGHVMCCRPPVLDGTFTLPSHTMWVQWTMDAAGLSMLEFHLVMENDPGPSVGHYFAPCNGTIDGTMFYLGIQTNLSHPDDGDIGKGLLFSRWDTLDPADARAGSGGFTVTSSSEGDFASTRMAYAWAPGPYTLRLARAEADGEQDWFDLTMIDEASGDETYVGGLRFPRASAGVPAAISPAFTTFTEIYAYVEAYRDVTDLVVAFTAAGNDGIAPVSARLEYPAWPTAEFPNADGYFDGEAGLVHLHHGAGIGRCHAPGELLY